MTTLQHDLLEIAALWHKEAEEARLASVEATDRIVQGQLCGLSTAFEIAATRIEALAAREDCPYPGKEKCSLDNVSTPEFDIFVT